MTENEAQCTQSDLFSESGDLRESRTRSSMLWSAYADALGFISELVDEKGLNRRTRGASLQTAVAWKRRVGGRGGVTVELPVGCWSDDTQLRMAVSRAIGHHGFDVESFARIELPVWPSYALGGGRASKAAAASLGKADSLWYANTFDGWANAGGNGAAMRIQPHVWSSPTLDGDFLLDVIVDSVCTHGHPRAIVGACFHAQTLAHCLREGVIPDRKTCMDIVSDVGGADQLLRDHRSLGSTWLGLWEEATGDAFHATWAATTDELLVAVDQAFAAADTKGDLSAAYGRIVDRLGLEEAAQRGSGILTPVAAAALAACATSTDQGVLVAANALGTDTDTIGTMAGALLGACHIDAGPPVEPLDVEFLTSEAHRLVALSRGDTLQGYSYPDLLTWTAPQAQADALVVSEGQLIVEGLGSVTEIGAEPTSTPRGDFAWQWVQTAFGQTLLIKRRAELKTLGAGNRLAPPPAPQSSSRSHKKARSSGRPASASSAKSPIDRGVNLDDAVDWARQRIADNSDLGYTVRRVARDGTLADLVALLSALRDDLRR